jgi:hypothetical protein
MSPCAKIIFKLFGILLLLALLIIPYKSTHVSFELNPDSKLIIRKTQHQRGYMFLFHYLKLRARIDSDIEHKDSYYLNTFQLTLEIAIILFLGVLDYFLFCLFLKKRKKKEES